MEITHLSCMPNIFYPNFKQIEQNRFVNIDAPAHITDVFISRQEP